MRYIKRIIDGVPAGSFGTGSRQFIYMERSFSPKVSCCIEACLDTIEMLFAHQGLEFVYLPKIAAPIAGQDFLDYIVPTGKRTATFATSDVYDMLFADVEEMPDAPFIMCCAQESARTTVDMWVIEGDGDLEVLDDLRRIVMDIADWRFAMDDIQLSCMASLCSCDAECDAFDADACAPVYESFRLEEERRTLELRSLEASKRREEDCGRSEKCSSFFGTKLFGKLKSDAYACANELVDDSDEDADDLVIPEPLPITVQWETTVNSMGADHLFNEVMASEQYIEATNRIYEAIEQLHRLGIGSLVIRSIAHKDGSLSRICIDDNYNITLPEYNNMSIEMAPMTKAVFLLFLRHEEGIVFKDLPDYKDELMVLYWDMVESDDEDAVRSKVERVTNPFNNAINEHCSRIKAAFALKFDDSLASSYYINGRRGEPKRISLPRSLVEWEMM